MKIDIEDFTTFVENFDLREMYWFCLMRNPSYRKDIDNFEKHFSDIIKVYGQKRKVKALSGYSSKSVLSNATHYLPIASPINSLLNKEDFESVKLANESYAAFIYKWRVEPFKYIHHLAPEIIQNPTPVLGTEVIEIKSEKNLIISLNQPIEPVKEIFDELLNETQLNQMPASQKESGALPKKAVQKRNESDIKNCLLTYYLWEKANFDREISPIIETVYFVSENSMKWPDEVMKLVKVYYAQSAEYPTIRKLLIKGSELINNPVPVLRTLLAASKP